MVTVPVYSVSSGVFSCDWSIVTDYKSYLWHLVSVSKYLSDKTAFFSIESGLCFHSLLLPTTHTCSKTMRSNKYLMHVFLLFLAGTVNGE